MWSHVPDDRLLDVLEGTANGSDRAHAGQCESCRTRLAEAAEGLAASAEVAVPEPSPHYWDTFRAQIGRRLDEAAVPARRRFFVPTLLAAAAVVVAVTFLPRQETVIPSGTSTVARTLPAWSALPTQEEDVSFEVLQGLEASAADIAGAGACVELTACVTSLSDEESGALADLLRDELGGKVL